MGHPSKPFALDVNVLIDLAEGKAFAQEFFEFARDFGAKLLLPPTAFFELLLLAERRPIAKLALESLIKWDVDAFELESLQNAIAKEFSVKLMRLGYLPEDQLNDGLILAECALHGRGIPILVTSDKHLLDIDHKSLKSALDESGLAQVIPFHPKGLSNWLRKRV